jgi:hypothetical protein
LGEPNSGVGVGKGHHRAYTKWNLVEGVIAASLLRQVRAGAVADAMTKLRSMLEHLHIDPNEYCKAPSTFAFSDFAVIFPQRTEPDDRASLPFGDEMGGDANLLAAARSTAPSAATSYSTAFSAAQRWSPPSALAGAAMASSSTRSMCTRPFAAGKS